MRSKVTTIFFIVLVAGSSIFVLSSNSKSEKTQRVVSVQGVPGGFEQAVNDAGKFYALFRKARELKESGRYSDAIELLNESLNYTTFDPEKAMVFYRLTEIYNQTGDLESELKYAELVPQYSANVDWRKKFTDRAKEIRQILAKQKVPGTPLGDRQI